MENVKDRIFSPADILEPVFAKDPDAMKKWAVIACDQFTSEPEYWNEAEKMAGYAPSSLRLTLPEVRLKGDIKDDVAAIHDSMERYIKDGIFKEYKNSYVYVERTLADGSIRRGLVGAIDLEEYDIFEDSKTPVRASERTVIERIPPRLAVREGAALELPHVLLLCDDDENMILGSINKELLPLIYDFDLMLNGGRIRAWLLQGRDAEFVTDRVDTYCLKTKEMYAAIGMEPVIFAVGDGNHSLATAKANWVDIKKANPGKDLSDHPARYALVELENIRDDCQQFQGIHRIITGTDPKALLAALLAEIAAVQGENLEEEAVKWFAGDDKGKASFRLNPGQLSITFLQHFLDKYLEDHEGSIDYIHGEETVERLSAKENTIGFALPPFDKTRLFRGIAADGVCPRKTFSIGHAVEKRYYIEARKIR